MSRITPLFLILVLSMTALQAAETTISGFTAAQPALGVTALDFELPAWRLDAQDVEGQIFQQIVIDGALFGSTVTPGQPELPSFTSLVAVPVQGEVSFEVVSMQEEMLATGRVWPVQREENTRFACDETFYASAGVYPAEQVQMGDAVMLRDYRVVPLTVNPFRYDPATGSLHVITQMQVRVLGDPMAAMHVRPTVSRSFEPLYRSAITNYETIRDEDAPYQPRNMIVVHSGNGQITDMLDQFVEWKRTKGFDVDVLDSSTVGNTSSNIKGYIQNAYNTWEYPPEYIVIIGDVTGSFGIPCWYASGGYGEGDHPYTMLDGTDLMPEAFVGRISIETTTHFATWLAKMNLVERQPYMGDLDYYHNSLMVGDTSPSGLSTILTSKYIMERIRTYDPIHTFYEMYSGNPSASQMVNYMNAGTLFFSYRGYLGMSGFNSGSISSMNNIDMPVNAVILTCSTGSFASGTSNTEHMMRAGTPSEPTGSHSSIGLATSGTHTQFNNIISGGIFHGLYSNDMHTMGEATMSGKLYLWLAYWGVSSGTVNSFTYWCNLMGDPSMDVWRGEPIDMETSFDGSIPLGQGWLDVSVVDDEAMPVAGAWVTARNDDESILARGYTDADGLLTLRFDPEVSGNIDLTTTKPDYIPQLESFTVNTTGGVSFFDMNIDDDNSGDSQGNSDGEANPGEIIELSVGLHNYSASTATGVTAVLSTDDPYITISDDSEDYGDIAVGATVQPSDDFDIEIAPDTPDRHEVVFTLEVTAGAQNWTSRLWLPISGCDLDVNDAWVEDGGNGMLDPGETATFKLTLVNDGQVTLTDVTAELTSLNGLVRVDDAEADFGSIAPGNNSTCDTNTFEITGLGLLVPGMFIPFELTLSNADGYSETEHFQLEVGVVTVTDPLGPDSYGYVAYDMGDIGYIDCPEYDWIEIDPGQGGPGTQLAINDTGEESDDIVFSELPFTFTFYGVDYDTIGVCSNGFVTFGLSEQKTFRNWVIPGALGPSPMIAVFWDELFTTGGGVYSWFDSESHTFVITWDCINWVGSAAEEFQLILYDPDYYLSSTFDGPIKMQYKQFNDVDSNMSPYNEQGNYCTIGLEDHTELVGLQYVYDNTYPTAAASLGHETALFFTGTPVSFEDSYLIMGDVVVHDEDGSGIIDAGETIDLGIYLENVGLSPATGVTATISSSDDYILLLTDTAEYSDIESTYTGVNEAFYTFNVLPSCPDGHVITFDIVCDDDDSSWNYTFSLVSYKPRLKMEASLIWDAEGNNDGIMDPGEDGLLIINIDNISDTFAADVVATLTSSSAAVTIIDTELSYPDIAAGDNAQRAFAYSVSDGAVVGESITFTFEVECAGGGTRNWTLQSTVGIWGWSTDFESGDEGFVGEDEWAYGIPNIDANSGLYAWGTDLMVFYNNNADESLYSNEYYIGASSQLIFWHDFRTQFDHDGCNVKISIDGGSSWNLIHPQGGYNGTANGSNAGIPNEPCFTGYSPGYSEVIFDVGDYAGNYATFRFHFGADGSTVAYGWTIDDVTVTGSQDMACKLSGSLTIDEPSIPLSSARVSVGESTVAPLDTGDWTLYVSEGTYDLTAWACYCEPQTEADVSILQGEVSAGHDFALTYLQPPYDIQADQLNGELTLTWDYDGELSRNSRREQGQRNRAVLQEFRVWRRIDTGNTELVADGIDDTLFVSSIDSLTNYYYWVDAVYDVGLSEATGEIPVYWDGSGVDGDGSGAPVAVTALGSNYPNPFNPETTVRFSLAQAGEVKLVVYNVRGQRVRTLLREYREPGNHEVLWLGDNDAGQPTASGVYFLRMTVAGFTQTSKMLLLK
ncbi:MAG: T9SS type A sorting domain-containing protein [Candidatus Cloacimonetes bacterium]|nr:T9SS type A sorting domain-containing protein [Candidatus Cloacimonadota bacterium]